MSPILFFILTSTLLIISPCYFLFLCNGLMTLDWKLVPPTVYLDDPTLNIHIMTVDKTLITHTLS